MFQPTRAATEPEIQAWCAAYLCKALKLSGSNLDLNADFATFGLDSAEAVFFVAAIEDWLGVELASDAAIEHPTIAQLAHFVAERLSRA